MSVADIVGGPREADSPKLFVGQLPRAFGPEDLRALFSEFGEISELMIIRDRETRQSKGCAFLTFCNRQSALNCIAALHDQRTLLGHNRPVQVKPADSESKAEERKLFVGMLSRTTTEEYLHQLFSQFGNVEEVAVLRNPDGTGKGCAFVRFTTRTEAQQAIQGLHNQITVEGARSPLIVRFAESEREKMQKRMMQQAYGMGMPYMGWNQMQNPMGGYTGMAGASMFGGASSQLGQPFGGDMQAAFSGVQQYNGSYSQQPYGQQMGGFAAGRKPRAGPEGANLYVAGLPFQYSESDLTSLFMPFGNVVSSHIVTDKSTGQSRGFGFVSYDNPQSAQVAIQSMNGYSVNGRTLKVSVKTPAPGVPY